MDARGSEDLFEGRYNGTVLTFGFEFGPAVSTVESRPLVTSKIVKSSTNVPHFNDSDLEV